MQSRNTPEEQNTGDKPGKYAQPAEREKLIQRLLQQRRVALHQQEELETWKQSRPGLESQQQQQYGDNVPADHEQQQHQQRAATPGPRLNVRSRSRSRQASHTPVSTRAVRPQSAGPRVGRVRGGGVSVGGGQANNFSRKSLDQVRRQVALENSKKCTFRPQINKTSASTRSSVHRSTRDARLKELSTPRKSRWDEQQRNVARRETREMAECTFRPHINSLSAELARRNYNENNNIYSSNNNNGTGKVTTAWADSVRHRERGGERVDHRLYEDSKQRAVAREKAGRERQEAVHTQHAFTPSINPISREIMRESDYVPLHERVEEVRRAREERISQAKLEVMNNNADLTFAPQLSETSRRMAEQAARDRRPSTNSRRGESGGSRMARQSNQGVVERLLHSAHETKRRKEDAARGQYKNNAHEYQFKPKVSENSQRMVQRNPDFAKGFVERQELISQRAKAMEGGMGRGSSSRHNIGGGGGGINVTNTAEDACTFTPNIGNAEQVLVHTRPQRLTETGKERVDRMAQTEWLRQQKLKSLISEEYYAQFDFQPKINHISKALGRSSGGHENLYRNALGRKKMQVKQLEAELVERKECTFRPRINRSSTTVDMDAVETSYDFLDPESVLETIAGMQRDKENRLQEQRREQEYQELRDCTFQPERLASSCAPKQQQGPVVVRGLGRYLELQEMARRKQEDKRMLEEKVFKANPIGNQTGYTVPKPFNLSTGRVANKQTATTTRIRKQHQHQSNASMRPSSHAQRQAELNRILYA